MPIVINSNNSNLFPVVGAGLNNFQFEPGVFYKYKVMEDVSTNNFSIQAFFPRFDLMNAYQGYSDFYVQITPTFQQSIPFLKVHGGPSFTASLGDEEDFYFSRTVNFTFYNDNLLSVGLYRSIVTFNVFATNPSGQVVSIQSRNFTVFQEIMAALTPRLNVVSKVQQLNFYYAGVIPAPQVFYVFSNQNVVVNNPMPTLIDISVEDFDLYKKYTVELTSAVADLTEDTLYLITIQDEGEELDPSVLRLKINLISPEESLQITPEVIDVTRKKGIVSDEVLECGIFSATPWQISGSIPNWLQINSVITPSISSLYIAVKSEILTEVGNYVGVIVFSNATATVTLTINLTLEDYISNPFQSGKYYFTKDLDFIRFSSSLENTYMEITVNGEFFKRQNFSESNSYERKYSIPLLNGKGDFHLGSVLHDLFDSEIPEVNFGLTFPYKPAKIDFSIVEKSYLSNEEVEDPISLNSIYFIQGKSFFTTTSGLSILSQRQFGLHRITPNSFIAVSYLSLPNSEITIKKNGSIIENVTPVNFSANAVLKTYFKFLQNLKPGDLIEFFVSHQNENRAVRFLVHTEGLNSANFAFINQNGVLDNVELTGRYRVSSSYNHTFFSKFKNLFSIDEKLTTVNKQSFVLNTGLMTTDEAALIDSLIKSKSIRLFIGSEDSIPVTCVSSRMVTFDSSENEIKYDLEFNLQTDSDAVFFVR